jgi:very-short-patch-repair endonuclease
MAYDQRRSQWLEKAGFRVMRFWNHEVLNQLESVSDAISNALIAR